MNIILENKRFEDVQRHILEDFYNRLIKKRRRVIGEDKKIRENMIKKLCKVNNDEDLQDILNGIEPLLQNKRRHILLMGENYEEVNNETKELIVKYITFVPKGVSTK